MITKQVTVNGRTYRVTLTEQVMNQVNTLKNLYEAAYEDPESFERVSSDISSTVSEISSSVEPAAGDGDLDGLIQEIIRIVDSRAAEVEQQMQDQSGQAKKSPKKKRQKQT